MDSCVATLNACKLTGSSLKRESKLYPHNQPRDYETAFDADTLWYDAIQTADQLHLICPKLNNLTSSIRSARWWVDGMPVYLRSIRFYHRYDILKFQVLPRQAQCITVKIGSWVSQCNISQSQSQTFSGLNAVVTMQKNNELDWILDFINFYIHNHQLESMILIDNNSTLYKLQDLYDICYQTNLKAMIIISAPFKYGPHVPELKNAVYEEQYLQCALLNITRLRYLSKARAVLNCDIDELAYTPKTTIFDLAKNNLLGFVALPCFYRYSNPIDHNSTRQAAHRFKKPSALRKLGVWVKWCIIPQGPTRWFSFCWEIHWLSFQDFGNSLIFRFFSYHFINRIINYIFKYIGLKFYKNYKFFHCFSTSTGWKEHRRSPPPRSEVVLDPEWSAVLDATFYPSDHSTSSYHLF